ncbi:hypothetical protein QEZ54_17880 [Catellatospora sp. KI3]|uniref:hypothetical protein n=1 Tax=Catellatospora sp. KI3 TaxID=3041620 RepID=UPI002482C95B|nr:hypothetical protein [Catellatospora sp. KI3]MDI1462849.1 hypothetical protein [Catellatospora sp. KI3]
MLRRTAAPRTPAAAFLSSWVMRLSLLLYVVADVILVLSDTHSAANTVGAVLWGVAGVLAVWATARWRYGLPAIVDRGSARQEAAWQADAEAGNPYAAHALGTSLKVRGELDPARRWLQAAAEAGLADAQWDLARLIDQVEGAAAARPWVEAAAAGGHPAARELLQAGGAYGTEVAS